MGDRIIEISSDEENVESAAASLKDDNKELISSATSTSSPNLEFGIKIVGITSLATAKVSAVEERKNDDVQSSNLYVPAVSTSGQHPERNPQILGVRSLAGNKATKKDNCSMPQGEQLLPDIIALDENGPQREMSLPENPCPNKIVEKPAHSTNNGDESNIIEPEISGLGKTDLAFHKFLALCIDLEQIPDDRVKLKTKMERALDRMNPNHRVSPAFSEFLSSQITKLQSNEKILYFCVKDFLDHVKLHKVSQRVVPTRMAPNSGKEDNMRPESEPMEDVEEDEVFSGLSSKQRHEVVVLTRTMEKLSRKIKKLGEAEVDLDDDYDSNYIRMRRYEERFAKVNKKIREITGQPSTLGLLPVKVKFHGTNNSAVNNLVQDWLNRRRIFPDFTDIHTLLKENAASLHLNLPPERLRDLAAEVFRSVGNKLQKRRKLNDWDTIRAYAEAFEDPATKDPQLESILRSNKIQSQKKADELCDEFCKRAVEDNLQPEEIPDDAPSSDESDKEENELGVEDHKNGGKNDDDDDSTQSIDDEENSTEKETKNGYKNCKSLRRDKELEQVEEEDERMDRSAESSCILEVPMRLVDPLASVASAPGSIQQDRLSTDSLEIIIEETLERPFINAHDSARALNRLGLSSQLSNHSADRKEAQLNLPVICPSDIRVNPYQRHRDLCNGAKIFAKSRNCARKATFRRSTSAGPSSTTSPPICLITQPISLRRTSSGHEDGPATKHRKVSFGNENTRPRDNDIEILHEKPAVVHINHFTVHPTLRSQDAFKDLNNIDIRLSNLGKYFRNMPMLGKLLNKENECMLIKKPTQFSNDKSTLLGITNKIEEKGLERAVVNRYLSRTQPSVTKRVRRKHIQASTICIRQQSVPVKHYGTGVSNGESTDSMPEHQKEEQSGQNGSRDASSGGSNSGSSSGDQDPNEGEKGDEDKPDDDNGDDSEAEYAEATEDEEESVEGGQVNEANDDNAVVEDLMEAISGGGNMEFTYGEAIDQETFDSEMLNQGVIPELVESTENHQECETFEAEDVISDGKQIDSESAKDSRNLSAEELQTNTEKIDTEVSNDDPLNDTCKEKDDSTKEGRDGIIHYNDKEKIDVANNGAQEGLETGSEKYTGDVSSDSETHIERLNLNKAKVEDSAEAQNLEDRLKERKETEEPIGSQVKTGPTNLDRLGLSTSGFKENSYNIPHEETNSDGSNGLEMHAQPVVGSSDVFPGEENLEMIAVSAESSDGTDRSMEAENHVLTEGVVQECIISKSLISEADDTVKNTTEPEICEESSTDEQVVQEQMSERVENKPKELNDSEITSCLPEVDDEGEKEITTDSREVVNKTEENESIVIAKEHGKNQEPLSTGHKECEFFGDLLNDNNIVIKDVREVEKSEFEDSSCNEQVISVDCRSAKENEDGATVGDDDEIEIISETIKPKVAQQQQRGQNAVTPDERVKRFLQNVPGSIEITVKRKRVVSDETKQALERLKKLKGVSATRVERPEPEIVVLPSSSSPQTLQSRNQHTTNRSSAPRMSTPQRHPFPNTKANQQRRSVNASPRGQPIRPRFNGVPLTPRPTGRLPCSQSNGMTRIRSQNNNLINTARPRGNLFPSLPMPRGYPRMIRPSNAARAITPMILSVRGNMQTRGRGGRPRARGRRPTVQGVRNSVQCVDLD